MELGQEVRTYTDSKNCSKSQAGLNCICNMHMWWEHHVTDKRPGSELQKCESQVEVTIKLPDRQGWAQVMRKYSPSQVSMQTSFFNS